jgi:UDP-N-acetylglucosamine acyltransferase
MIHPTAVIHPKAELHPTVLVGPYAVIDEHVVVGPHCRIGPHVHLSGDTTIGSHNRFHAGAVIGDTPQDLKYEGERTRLRIGDQNVFREHTTVHRSTKPGEETVIGSNNLLMAHCHLAHNVVLGNHIIVACGALLAGYVTVEDRAVISGNCLVHQFVRIGTLAMMQGGSAISKDLPPFTVARGDNGICGLNTVGLRRAAFSSQDRLELKQLYHALFRSGEKLQSALESAQKKFSSPSARSLLAFVAASKRGICRDVGTRNMDAIDPDALD